jgi:hypothetical protein
MTLTTAPPTAEPTGQPTAQTAGQPTAQPAGTDVSGTGEVQSHDSRRWRALPVVLSATFMSLFEPNCIYAGVPAQMIRKIEDDSRNL